MQKNFASSTALSLAQAGAKEPVAALVVGGVLVTVAAAVFVYKQFESFEEKKYRKEIQKINNLHKKYLERIYVPGFNDVQGFPPIFKLNTDEKSGIASSLHYTRDEVEAIGKQLPHGSDIALSGYRQKVQSAIFKIKEYYFSRDNHRDTTAGVLSYLLNMLDTKCLNFQGYDYDIAYLDAISKFIVAYSSLEGRTNSQHFSRLQPAVAYIREAKQALERHKESLSLEELIAELRDNCTNCSASLLRKLVKMMVPTQYAHLSETAAIEELGERILRKRYVSAQVLGLELKHDEEIILPKSVFQDWIEALADYYLMSLNPVGRLLDPEKWAPAELFKFTEKARSIERMLGHGTIDKKELERYQKQMHQIREIFEHSHNFINTKLVKKNKESKFEPVTQDKDILDRTEVMADFSRVIHSVISMQYLCTHLLKSIKQLGDLYAKDPDHCREIFEVLVNLCEVIRRSVVKVNHAFAEISNASENTMRLEHEELFSHEIQEDLDTIERTMENLGGEIVNYRTKLNQKAPITIATVSYEMKAVADLMDKMYPCKHTGPGAASRFFRIVQQATSSVKKSPNKETPLATTEARDEPVVAKVALATEEQRIKNLRDVSTDVLRKISLVQAQTLKDPQLAKYKTIQQALNDLKTKAITLLQEQGKDEARSDKANSIATLAYSLSEKFSDFLALEPAQRYNETADFIEEISDAINEQDVVDHVDLHNNMIKRYLSRCLGGVGFFRTDTRSKLMVLHEACSGLKVGV